MLFSSNILYSIEYSLWKVSLSTVSVIRLWALVVSLRKFFPRGCDRRSIWPFGDTLPCTIAICNDWNHIVWGFPSACCFHVDWWSVRSYIHSFVPGRLGTAEFVVSLYLHCKFYGIIKFFNWISVSPTPKIQLKNSGKLRTIMHDFVSSSHDINVSILLIFIRKRREGRQVPKILAKTIQWGRIKNILEE